MEKNYIYNIVKASGVTRGELILIHFWGEDSDKAIANEFMIATIVLGATPVFLQESRTINRNIFEKVTDTCFGEKYFSIFSNFDAVLDVFTYQPIILGYEIEAEKFKRYRLYMAKMFSVLTKVKRFTQIRVPTEANAAESGLKADEYIRRMDNAYNIDYDELIISCVRAKEKIKVHNQIVLNSGNNCTLFFDLTNRTWHIDAGDGDWPCGEIYIAPNETKTNGKVFFDRLFIDGIGEYSKVTFNIENGEAISSDNEEITFYLSQLPQENRIVCELGLGMNPNVTDLCGYAVLDEKMGNSFHIALGANNMFGGQNAASTHMDFVGSGKFHILPIDCGV